MEIIEKDNKENNEILSTLISSYEILESKLANINKEIKVLELELKGVNF